jgi:hypothetical protein
MKNLVVSFSGGRTSGFMAWHIQNSPKYSEYNKLFIFANTGKEREETLEFVERCDKAFGLGLVWVESVVTLQKGIGIEAITTNFAKASRQGEPFEAVLQKENMGKQKTGVPCFVAPYCSERLKKTPINKFAKEYFNKQEYTTSLGFRYEDYLNNRVTKAQMKPENFCGVIYPLLQDFEAMQNQKDVLQFWLNMPFDLQLKPHQSNCDLCYKKSNLDKVRILRENPEIAQWWTEQENKWGGQFHYNNATTQDLLEKSKGAYNADLFDFESECICT